MEHGPVRDDGQDHPPPPGAHGRVALVISHPAHELLIHGWMAATRPRVHVLTDGSGRAGRPRLHHTTRVLAEAGATPGEIYGRLPDRALYDAVLQGDVGTFTDLARELAATLLRDGIDSVVGDSLEHNILAHDLCHMVLRAAVELANRERQRPILTFDFVLMNSRETCVQGRCRATWRRELDSPAFERKRAATAGYAPILSEVDDLVARHGLHAFRLECLHPSVPSAALLERPPGKPVYESHGEALVAAGVYERLVRYEEHVRPLAEALWQAVSGPAGPGPAPRPSSPREPGPDATPRAPDA